MVLFYLSIKKVFLNLVKGPLHLFNIIPVKSMSKQSKVSLQQHIRRLFMRIQSTLIFLKKLRKPPTFRFEIFYPSSQSNDFIFRLLNFVILLFVWLFQKSAEFCNCSNST